MIAVFVVLVGSSALLGLWFLVALGAPWRSESPSAAWLQAALAYVTVAFDLALLLALFKIPVSAWAYVVILLGQDVVFAWRIVLLFRTRSMDRPSRKETNAP